MNASGFQTLVAQLGELSEVQREALLTALKHKRPTDVARRWITCCRISKAQPSSAF
jgi:hypothetical protein